MPIPGFKGTGNILGAGAAVHAEYKIEGTEYGGFPPPLIGVNFYLPQRHQAAHHGLPDVREKLSNRPVPSGCSKARTPARPGTRSGSSSFGSERVEETTTLSPSTAPGGGFEFFTDGHSPVSLEILSAGHYVNLGGAGGYGPELITQIPLVSTVPGAPYASVKTINVKAGSAYKSQGKTVPTTAACPPSARRAASRSRPK